ncbi:MAG: hydrogenase maturation nickel metallochaperone HypA [Candidatus Sumerlaeia bacterium]
MHEMSIASSLFQQVEEITRDQAIHDVSEVEVEIGVLQLVVPEALVMAWDALRKDTCLQDATLKIVEVAPLARCRQCGKEFEPSVDMFLCPDCTIADVEILAGNDIILKSIIGEKEEAE